MADTLSPVQDRYKIHPITPDRWNYLLRLFGPNGAYSNCWCTWCVLSNREGETAGASGRHTLLAKMVRNGSVPGLLAYSGEDPVGWVAVGPRDRYVPMIPPRSRVFRPPDDRPSWAINCFFVPRQWRRRGVATALLQAAVDHARCGGAERIDAYPKDTSANRATSAELFVGSLRMFGDAGFGEVSRTNRGPMVRLGK